MTILISKVLPVAWAAALAMAACSPESESTAKPETPATQTQAATETTPAKAAAKPAAELPAGDVVAEGSDKTYTFKVVAPSQSAPGKPITVGVEVVPKTGWKMNMDFPTKLQITAPDTATVKGGEQAKEDAAEFVNHHALWTAEVTPAAAGSKELSVELRFAVCTATTCVPKREQATWAMTVQ